MLLSGIKLETTKSFEDGIEVGHPPMRLGMNGSQHSDDHLRMNMRTVMKGLVYLILEQV